MDASVKKQTLLVTGLNGMIRVMGFFLRILMSRMLGAEMMGIAELASGVHMMAITPLTSGLPMAISRLTAKASDHQQTEPLQTGLWLVRRVALWLIPLFLLLSPLIARWTGDIRVLPSLWFTAPCILILGYIAYVFYYQRTQRLEIAQRTALQEERSRAMVYQSLRMNASRHSTISDEIKKRGIDLPDSPTPPKTIKKQ